MSDIVLPAYPYADSLPPAGTTTTTTLKAWFINSGRAWTCTDLKAYITLYVASDAYDFNDDYGDDTPGSTSITSLTVGAVGTGQAVLVSPVVYDDGDWYDDDMWALWEEEVAELVEATPSASVAFDFWGFINENGGASRKHSVAGATAANRTTGRKAARARTAGATAANRTTTRKARSPRMARTATNRTTAAKERKARTTGCTIAVPTAIFVSCAPEATAVWETFRALTDEYRPTISGSLEEEGPSTELVGFERVEFAAPVAGTAFPTDNTVSVEIHLQGTVEDFLQYSKQSALHTALIARRA